MWMRTVTCQEELEEEDVHQPNNGNLRGGGRGGGREGCWVLLTTRWLAAEKAVILGETCEGRQGGGGQEDLGRRDQQWGCRARNGIPRPGQHKPRQRRRGAGEQQLQSETNTGGGRFRRIGRVCSQLRQRKCRWKAVLQAFHSVVWSWD